MVAAHGLTITAAGLTIGLALAWAATRGMSALLYEVSATDPITFVGVLALLAAVALAACTVPALRAARLDPMDVLRQE